MKPHMGSWKGQGALGRRCPISMGVEYPDDEFCTFIGLVWHMGVFSDMDTLVPLCQCPAVSCQWRAGGGWWWAGPALGLKLSCRAPECHASGVGIQVLCHSPLLDRVMGSPPGCGDLHSRPVGDECGVLWAAGCAWSGFQGCHSMIQLNIGKKSQQVSNSVLCKRRWLYRIRPWFTLFRLMLRRNTLDGEL